MRIADFLNDEFFSLPKTQGPKEDYKTFITKSFKQFIEKIDSVEQFDDLSFDITVIKERLHHLVNQLKLVVEEYYGGRPASALEELEKGLNSSLKNFEELLNIRSFYPESNFYRVRIHKENFPLSTENFFHIPFDLRGRIKTQRFSIPGFPSLYLGTSSYVCWEELNRPNLNDFQIVRLNNTKELKVIDLSPPKKEQSLLLVEEDQLAYIYYKSLMIWPLVFASSVRVRNYSDDFKPEYIIPQLLLQWVRKNDEIDGISYQTTHIDLSNSLSKGEFLNVVLPVKENKTRGLCSILEENFRMTEATSVQLNQCSNSNADESLHSPSRYRINKIELIKGSPTDYDLSIFGQLEDILGTMRLDKIIKK